MRQRKGNQNIQKLLVSVATTSQNKVDRHPICLKIPAAQNQLTEEIRK